MSLHIALLKIVGRIMNIFNYFKEIKKRINKIDSYVTNPINYRDINNPFASTLPKTYVWLEEDDCSKKFT